MKCSLRPPHRNRFPASTSLSCIAGAVLLSVTAGAAIAQQAEEATPEDTPWTHKLVGGLNLAQVALKDWAGGGDDALAWTATLSGHSDYGTERLLWINRHSMAFGQTKLGDAGIRKTDDKIDLSSTLTYVVGVYVNPYVAATLKTQFAKGYNYTESGKVDISQFFDPAYLTQTAGVGYRPWPQLKTRAGLGLREIITRDYNSYADDEDTAKIERVMVDAGMESVTDAEWQLADNLLIASTLELFAPLTKLDQTSIRNETNLNLAVNRYISTNVNLQIVEDESASPDTQIKQTLAVGLTYTFI